MASQADLNKNGPILVHNVGNVGRMGKNKEKSVYDVDNAKSAMGEKKTVKFPK